MPLFDYKCQNCGKIVEILVTGSEENLKCQDCGSENMTKLVSAHSSISGTNKMSMPGPGDTGCCGLSPGHEGCAGPGSCCGRA